MNKMHKLIKENIGKIVVSKHLVRRVQKAKLFRNFLIRPIKGKTNEYRYLTSSSNNKSYLLVEIKCREVNGGQTHEVILQPPVIVKHLQGHTLSLTNHSNAFSSQQGILLNPLLLYCFYLVSVVQKGKVVGICYTTYSPSTHLSYFSP